MRTMALYTATPKDFDAARTNPTVPGGERTAAAIAGILAELRPPAAATASPAAPPPAHRTLGANRRAGKHPHPHPQPHHARRTASAPVCAPPPAAARREASCRRRVLSCLNRVSALTFERMRLELGDAVSKASPAEASDAARMLLEKARREPRAISDLYVRLLLETAAGLWSPETGEPLLARAREEAQAAVLHATIERLTEVSGNDPDPSKDYDGFCDSVRQRTELVGRVRIACFLARRPALGSVPALEVAEAYLAALERLADAGGGEAALELALECLTAAAEEGGAEARQRTRRRAAELLRDRVPSLGSRARHKALVLIGGPAGRA